MGNWVTLEALRQMAIRDGRVAPKIKNVLLAAPDVDVDLSASRSWTWARCVSEFTLFVSQDDRALGNSRRIWGDAVRLGPSIPIRSPIARVERSGITVVNLSELRTGDPLNHSKFAESAEVVQHHRPGTGRRADTDGFPGRHRRPDHSGYGRRRRDSRHGRRACRLRSGRNRRSPNPGKFPGPRRQPGTGCRRDCQSLAFSLRRGRRDPGDLGRGLLAEPAVEDAAERAADQRRDPEQPELRQRPAADEQRRAGAAGRVDRGVGDRDADEVDQRQAEADGDRGEARPAPCRAWRP